MAKSVLSQKNHVALRATRISFYFVALYAAVIVISDAWNLITPEIVMQRWTYAVVLLAVTTISWYLLKSSRGIRVPAKVVVWAQILTYVIITTLTVYTQRGVASRSVILYVVPIVLAATLASRAAIITTAAISSAAYALASIRYFYLNYGEAYKVELYGELILYGGLLLVIAALLITVLKPPDY